MGELGDVYFIRHKRKTDDLLKELRGRKIAYFFTGRTRHDENVEHFLNCDEKTGIFKGYKKTKKGSKNKAGKEFQDGSKVAVRYFNDLSIEGGIVCAEYGNENELFIVKIKPKTIGYINEHIIDGEGANAKTLEYTVLEKVSYLEYPQLSALRPIQSTISKPQKAYSQIIECIIEGKISKDNWNVQLLHPKTLEQLCNEWLRRERGLSYCILGVGSNLKDVDIVGYKEYNTTKIFAQVTHKKDDKAKEKTFEHYAENTKNNNEYYYFSASNKEGKEGNIEYVNIEKVFNSFDFDIQKNMVGLPMLKKEYEVIQTVQF